MSAAKPRRCPDCRARVAQRRLRTMLRWQGVAFCECPKCRVGSPRKEWTKGQKSR